MQIPVFEQAYLLQSIGWAIANSFWQTGILWLIYQGITSFDKKLPALIKYHLSLVLLTISFGWFCFTIVKNYNLLTNNTTGLIIPFGKIIWGLHTVNHYLPFISLAYLVLLCYYVIKYFRNLSANLFIQKNGLTKAPIDFRLFTNYTAIELGIKKKIKVWLSAHVDVPSVTGFFKPVILLPAAIVSQLSVQQIEAILLHELAHIRRNDYLLNLLQSIVELVLFFNPFASLLSKTAKREREYCCDEWVINYKYNQHDYANALLLLEEHRHLQPTTFSLAATNGKKNLLLRIKRLFSTAPQTTVSTLHKIKLSVLSILLVVGIVTLMPLFPNNHPVVKSHFKASSNKIKKINLFIPRKSIEDEYAGKVLMAPIVKSIASKKPQARKHIPNKPASTSAGLEYVDAFINEELLNPVKQPTDFPTYVVEKELNNNNYIIKIEEQQSGNIETNTYYFELKNKDGNIEMKPLIIFNKYKESGKKAVKKQLRDSTGNSIQTNIKKRIAA